MDRPFLRALIVDDDPSTARLFSRCLGMWGWDAEICHSASAALELFAERRYGMAICDVNIGSDDGIFLAKLLRKVKPSLFVIIASGSRENLDRARMEDFSHCLHKPFVLGEFQAMVGDYENLVKEPVNIDKFA
ncbi:MAG: response regulator [Elusimicrobia bacterium]|nr:response regulator [Elusimicrobiota bacterium]